jgi:hydroxymethylbilane synthase
MRTLRLGTRGSKLALWQADYVSRELCRAVPDLIVEIIIIKTKGDKVLDVALSKIGDKGLFTREIENELLAGKIDLAVHSLKDLPSILASGLILGGVLQREDPRDVLISHQGYTINSLPPGARVGTSSLRRIAQLKALRPDLNMVDLRGNVETRIRKMEAEGLDGIILAYAGVKRLGFVGSISEIISADLVLPAVGQGAVAVEIRADDYETGESVSAINDPDSFTETLAERAFLATLEGGCQVPIASLARIKGQEIQMEGLVTSLDGQRVIRGEMAGNAQNAEQIGRKLALSLLDKGAGIILEEIRRLGAL